MICAEWDPALPPALAANMPNQIADLEMVTIPQAGHWVQQESPDAVNTALVDWLQRRFA
jgi:pimeloyl-ACP methyl ester carboxylesterase